MKIKELVEKKLNLNPNIAKTNKKMKWANKRKRIFDALESNAHNDQYESMLENISMITSDEFLNKKNGILFIAVKNGSKRCSEFLLSKGATINCLDVIINCEYTKMVEVFYLLKEFYINYKESFRVRSNDQSKYRYGKNGING